MSDRERKEEEKEGLKQGRERVIEICSTKCPISSSKEGGQTDTYRAWEHTSVSAVTLHFIPLVKDRAPLLTHTLHTSADRE